MKRSSVSSVADRRLEHVVGADHVHAHRPHRALEHGVDAGDRGAVDDVRRAARELAHRVQRRARPPGGSVKFGCSASGVPGERVAVEVVGRDDLVLVDEPAGERRADEAGAAGDEDPLAREHAASLSARYRFQSDADRRPDRAARRRRRVRRRPSARPSAPPDDRARRCPYWPQGDGNGRADAGGRSAASPPGARFRQRAAACRRLAAMKNPFAPLPEDVICTDALRRAAAGADRRHATSGRADLDAHARRRNGCEIARWNRLGFLVGGGSAGGGAEASADSIARDVSTVLFVGAGRHQRRAILRAKELGLRVVAVDRNPDALGLAGGRRGRGRRLHGRRRGHRGRPAPRRRRRPDRLGRPRRARRRRRRRGARAARDRRRDRAPDDPQDRDAADARRRGRAAAALRRRARPAERPRGARRRRRAGRAEAGRLGRAARHLLRRVAGRARRAPARGARRVADRRGDRRELPRRARAERDRDRARRRGVPAHALRPAAPARDRLRRRLDPRLPRVDLRATCSPRRSASPSTRCTRSGCATGSPSRS